MKINWSFIEPVRDQAARLRGDFTAKSEIVKLAEQQAEIERLREENARLREALAPFVDAGHLKVYISSASTKEECWVSINIKNRDLRAAAAAILGDVKAEAACPELDEAP